MKRLFFILIFIPFISLGQNINFSDGPYIFIKKNKLIEKSIINGQVMSKEIDINKYDTIYYPSKSSFSKVKKIAALSDIHGQFDLLIQLLKNNKIIDKNLNWNFNDGHLVIVGDVFDRGDKVNQILWLLYKLENQANKMGGHMHFLLGNHEYMVLQKDLRYINRKYKFSARSLDLNYDELYGKETILGRWLRSKPTIIKINNTVFTHGGVSKKFIRNRGVDFEEINNIMRNNIDFSPKKMKSRDYYKLYSSEESLVWYRDYFKEYGNELSEKDISEILNQLNSEHIVVGHCPYDEIISLFNNRIFGVDSSIQKGIYGEVLFIENDQFYRGTLDGEIIKIEAEVN